MPQALFDPPTPHQQRTWKALVELTKARLRSQKRGTFLYGDLAKKLFGARHRGGLTFGNPLGEIHHRTLEYNRKFETRHPLLNALVFNKEGTQPGIPRGQNSDEIWNVLEQSGPRYLDRLAVLLGYEDFAGNSPGSQEKQPGRTQDAGGAQAGGKRSAATWSAKRSPYVKEIGRVLDKLGWKQRIDGRPWQPDILRGSPTTSKRILIEVKPDCDTHNIITATGQVTCYSSDLNDVIKVVAFPGSKSLQPHMTNVLESNGIKILDLDEADLVPLVGVIVE